MHAMSQWRTPLRAGTCSVGSAYECRLTRGELIAALAAYEGERRWAFFRPTADGSIVCAACGLHLGVHEDLVTLGQALLAFLHLGALAVVAVVGLCACWLWLFVPFDVHVTTTRR
jgi:hypothetical protein